MKIIAVGSIVVGILLTFVIIDNTLAGEGTMDLSELFEIPVAYGHFSDDFPLECGLIPDLEQCNKSFTHEIRDWIFDFLFGFFADQINPIS